MRGARERHLCGSEWADRAFRLAREAWGNGYGHQLGLASFHLAFEQLDADAVHAIVRPDNERILQALEQLGMHQTETVRDVPDAPPSLVYSITADAARAARL